MDKISEMLGTETGVTVYEMKEVVTDEAKTLNAVKEENLRNDYDFVRQNLKNAIEQSSSLVFSAVNLARESESPRSYESLSIFLKTISEMGKDLLDISSTKESKSVKSEDIKSVTNNSIFVGTTDNLLDLINKEKSVN